MLACQLFLPGALAAAALPGGPLIAPALREIAVMRRQAGCAPGPVEDTEREVSFRGRPAVELTGRAAGAGAVADRAVLDRAAARIVSYVCLANASARQAGEAIVSMGEISSRADGVLSAILPGAGLALESILRRRESEGESVYYEARYAAPPGDYPFFEPPLTLLLNASTGSLFRLDVDPDWLDPPAPPRALISRKAAERIAAVVLRGRDLAPALGQGAGVARLAATDLFTVHPNGWLEDPRDAPDVRARVAWVVLFWTTGGTSPGPHRLFVDAATGRVLGGLASEPAAAEAR